MFDKNPKIKVTGWDSSAWQGYSTIVETIDSQVAAIGKAKTVVAIDFYHGVREQEVVSSLIEPLGAVASFNVGEANHSEEYVGAMLKRNITDDRVFGVLSCHTIDEFFDSNKVADTQGAIAGIEAGLVVVYGVGAAHVFDTADIVVYADLARWEIQQRYRSGELSNWCSTNYDEEILRKYKRGFFIDWRVIDRHKMSLYSKIDYVLDTNVKDDPKMVSGDAFRDGVKQVANKPFKLVPYFDPGAWGGQWMRDVCELDKDKPNFAWGFNCVPEENSMLLEFGETVVELPSIDAVFFEPIDLMGDKVYSRFGTEFPIRFDFLDTIGGGNLSFQVHPMTEYIQQTFGMHYTQDESYYMLEADPGATVYLGTKTGIDPDAMIADLEAAQRGEKSFDDAQFANEFPCKKHDHFLIPAGTVHCSGVGGMVLEISATPYIFTFKLWDWGRLGMDGKPRPVHLEHGKKAIQWERDTEWVKKNLINRVEPLGEGDGWREERTGLHELEFIETRRHWFSKSVMHDTEGGVNVLCLIEGDEAIVESPDGKFEPMIVSYIETFVVPASVGKYSIRPYGRSEGKTIGTLKAYVRT